MPPTIGGDTPADGERSALDGARGSSSIPWAQVPWRVIVASALVASGFLLATLFVIEAFRTIALVIIAGFFAAVLAPAVRHVEGWTRGHRGIAVGVVMFGTLLVALGTVGLFVFPIHSQLIDVASDLPGTVRNASQGRGAVGHIVTRLHLRQFVLDHQDGLQKWADDVDKSSFDVLRATVVGFLSSATVFVITYFLLLQSSALGAATLNLMPARRRAAAHRVAVDASKAVSGYMVGNLLISLVAGVTAFICLAAVGVPNAGVLALWVAFADLIPLVGATLGAAVAVFAAFLHTSLAGFIALAFFIVYQQIENSVLQPKVMARTVRVNPLVILLSVLVGVELFGFGGALLAIPFAGIAQVIGREFHQERTRERFDIPEDR